MMWPADGVTRQTSQGGAPLNPMPKITTERMTAQIEGDFVVFLIGMRINSLWKIHKWLPVAIAMRRMVNELQAKPDSGFLGRVFGIPVIVQYWRSFEHLEAYARNQDQEHWPAWVNFNQRIRNSQGDVGIWHETYKVRAGEYESIYVDMPAFGLGKFTTLAPISASHDSAKARLAENASRIQK